MTISIAQAELKDQQSRVRGCMARPAANTLPAVQENE